MMLFFLYDTAVILTVTGGDDPHPTLSGPGDFYAVIPYLIHTERLTPTAVVFTELIPTRKVVAAAASTASQLYTGTPHWLQVYL